MHTPNWSNILLIAARETRDQLRDRRTLFMIAVLPMLLYPIIGMSFLQMAQFFRMHPSKTLFISAEPIPESARLIVDGDLFAGADTPFTGLQVVAQVEPLISPDHVRGKASRLIERTVYDVVVCLPPGFVHRLVADKQEAAQEPLNDKVWPDEPIVFYSAANDNSRIAYERVSAALDHWRARQVEQTLHAHRLTDADVHPFRATPEDISDPIVRRAVIWSKVLPFVLVIWAMTGAFYPAVDLCAGEKERGTLETLLSSPAERTEIVWGKLITVMLFSIATAMLNMASMCLTAGFIVSKTTQALGATTFGTVGAPPISSLLWLSVALIPISALFSALSLALAAMARSTKEGQYYLMPLLLTTMPLLMLSFMPAVGLELGTAIIPVTGVVLLLRQLMEGHYAQSLVFLGPVVAVTALCCLIAIRWAVDQFTNEDVLFRESERLSLRTWVRHLVRDRLPLPTVGEAVLCGVLILLIRFFAGLSLPFPTSWHGFVATTAITLLAFVAAPALIMTIILTTRPAETLLLKKTTLGRMTWAVLLAAALHPLAVCVLAFVGDVYPIDESVLAPLQAVLSQAPGVPALLLVLAVLPAVCEEVAFRGFILSGLRSTGHRWRAVLVSSLLFGLAHGMLQQSIVATLFGLVLGYLAIQTGSLLPCVLFHAAHNSLGLLSPRWLAWLGERFADSPWLVQSLGSSSSAGGLQYVYGPPVVLLASLVALRILYWFYQHQAVVAGNAGATKQEQTDSYVAVG